MQQTKKREKENELEKQRQLKRQNQLRQTLKRLICELDAENFDYKSWITNNKSEPSPAAEEAEAPSTSQTDADLLDCSYGDDMTGGEFDDDFDDDSALSGKSFDLAARRQSCKG